MLTQGNGAMKLTSSILSIVAGALWIAVGVLGIISWSKD